MSNNDSDENNEDNEAHELISAPRHHRRRMGDVDRAEIGSSTWLISFTDVMALMLTFFVMLFAMSEPAQKDWEEIMAALKNEFKSFYGPSFNMGPQDTINLARVNYDDALDIGYLNSLVKSILAESKLLERATLNRDGARLIISLPQDFLFDAGRADIKENGSKALYALGGTLSKIKNKIEVIGHADPRPIQGESGPYSNNWQLSLARATNVAAIMQKVGYERDITIRGLSDGRYNDLSGLEDENLRLEIARRVDIIVLDHDGRKTKVFSDENFR